MIILKQLLKLNKKMLLVGIFLSTCHEIFTTLKQSFQLHALSQKMKLLLKHNLDDDEIVEEENLFDDDKILREIFIVGTDIYHKIIELVALYYFAEFGVEIEALYDQSLFDISKKVLQLIYLLSKYVPLVCKNKQISVFIKVKKLSYVGSVLFVSVLWLKAFGQYQKDKYYLFVDES